MNVEFVGLITDAQNLKKEKKVCSFGQNMLSKMNIDNANQTTNSHFRHKSPQRSV